MEDVQCLDDAYCTGFLSNGVNAPPLVPMCLASGAFGGCKCIQGAARTGGQRIPDC